MQDKQAKKLRSIVVCPAGPLRLACGKTHLREKQPNFLY